MTVRNIYDYIDEIAPFGNQESYDNSGLLIGSFDAEVKKVCICLDVTINVVKEAKKKSADLIISHHPVIFKPISAIESDSAVYKLAESGISCIAAHTDYDMAGHGLSDAMLELLGLPNNGEVLSVINPDGSGFGRISEAESGISAAELAKLCKNTFKCGSIRYVDGGRMIKRIAVCSGAGGDDLTYAIEKKCDAFITGDVKHSAFVYAENKGITLIDAGHFNTEIIFCDMLCGKLKTRFPDIDVFTAESTVGINFV